MEWHYVSNYSIEPTRKEMRIKHLVLSFAAMLIVFSIQAQRAILMGTISNPTSSFVKVNYESNLLDGSDVSYEADLDGKNGYIFLMPLEGITVVNLYYNKNNVKILLRPGDQLTFDFESSGFENNIMFAGDGARDNRLYHAYNKEFNLLSHQYKSAFIVDYPIPQRILEKMKSTGPNEFESFVKTSKQNESNFYLQALEKYGPTIEVAEYMQDLIDYKWALMRLYYPNINKQGFAIEDSYYDYLKTINLSNERAFGMKEYLSFLNVFSEHLFVDALKEQGLEDGSFEEKYSLMERFFTGPTRDYVLAQMLMRTVNRDNYGQIAHLFNSYTATATTEKPLSTIRNAILRLNQFGEGTLAPEFQLTDAYGTQRNLSDYRGKVVYLSFWASWCKPCVAEIDESRSNRMALTNDDIIFLYVSVDRSNEKWVTARNANSIEGVNLWAGSSKSSAERDYEITSLPRYFLIDRNGRFVTNFPKASDAEFVDRVKGML